MLVCRGMVVLGMVGHLEVVLHACQGCRPTQMWNKPTSRTILLSFGLSNHCYVPKRCTLSHAVRTGRGGLLKEPHKTVNPWNIKV
eukprot:2078099-Amphidinium_carterae.1